MIWQKKILLEGLDGDSSTRLIGDKSALNLMNARVSISQYGRNLRAENIPGTALVSQQVYPPYGSSQTIGSAVDFDSGRLLWFNYNTFSDHGIYCYDPALNRVFAVVYDSQVIGGLGFSRSSLIHSARVENGCLYWCDSTNNEPRRININAGIEMNHAGTFSDVTPYQYPMSQFVLYWIRRQPGLPLSGVKSTDATFENNFIKNEAFQFYWRYIYRDYETSTLSGLSLLNNYNDLNDTFNFISITAPLGETIQQDVLQVDFVAKYINGGKSFVIKSWNKNIPLDNLAIYQHNFGVPLTFNFYNDFTGIALDDAYSVKPYDSLPIYAQTIEMARNRSFMANYTIGYDTPMQTSLQASASVQTGAGALTGLWIVVRYNSGANTANYIYLPDFNTFFSPGPYVPSNPVVDYTFLTLVATGWGNFTSYAFGLYGPLTSVNYEGSQSTITNGPPVPGLAGDVAFKSGASYQVSINFFDHAGRKCGILTSESLKISVAEKIYAQVDYTTAINWALSNAAAANEIPVWAYYYSVNITKCLTTRFFLDSRVKNITYVKKVVATGDYDFNTSAYAANLNGVGIDITLLNSYGMGYVFADGDLVKVYIGTDVFDLSIIAQDGNWIVCELQNLGALGDTGTPKKDVLFEIFTPYKPSTSEPYYEVGQIFSIDNPTTISRMYSTVAGTITGDVTLLTRNDGTNDYLTENMSPNDKFYLKWNTNSGRPNFIDRIGQQVLTNSIAWSNVLIQGGQVNGLSTFDALDVKDISIECGDISKLQVANKVSDEQGTIMLAICIHQTASLYLGETQLVGSAQNAFVAQSTGVIGTINILQGSYGTSHPESVFEYLGLVFFIDILNGKFLQYSNNGLDDVSRYKMTRFFQRYCQDYLTASTGNLDNINGFHHIRGNVNPFTKEVLITLPGLIYENYANVLPSYSSVPSYATSIIDRFDIYDRLGKTMSFMFEQNPNYWGSNYEGMPEWSENLNNQLYTWKNGNLYINDSDIVNWNRFYGVDYPVRFCGAWNNVPSAIKDAGGLGIEGSAVPDFTVLMSTTPNLQITDLSSTDVGWEDQEGVWYSPFLMDRLSPNCIGTADEKLYLGDVIKSPYPLFMCEWQVYSGLFYLEFINFHYNLSRGQKQLITEP